MKNKKGLKIFICICVGLISVGIVFAGIGFLIGGTGNFYYEKGRGLLPSTAFESAVFSGKTETVNRDLETFTDIQVYAGLSEINFIESDKYAVEYCYDTKLGEPDLSVEAGNLVYKDQLYKRKWNNIGLGGLRKLNVPLYVNIYYPKGAEFELVSVKSDLGTLSIEGLKSKSLEAEASLGEINLERINIKCLDLSADLGDIDIKDAVTEGMKITADMGDIDISGELRGKNKIDCDMGSINIETSLSQEEYDYDINVDMGDVEIGGDDKRNSYSKNNNAGNSFVVENSMGDINIDFNN